METLGQVAKLIRQPQQADLAMRLLPAGPGDPRGHGIAGRHPDRHSEGQWLEPLRVLIVEDEALVALDMASVLGDGGHETVGLVATEEAAVEKAAELAPDLVVMDIKLKSTGDGIRASERIVASHDIPILYITAYNDQETMDRLGRTGPVQVLFKPFDRQAFLAAVDAALASRRH